MKIKKNTNYLIETKEDLQDFLERCEKKGWKWITRDKPTKFELIYSEALPLVIITGDDGLTWSYCGSHNEDKVYKRKDKKQKHYYAKIKGWELIDGDGLNWCYKQNKNGLGNLFLSFESESDEEYKTLLGNVGKWWRRSNDNQRKRLN